VREFLESVDRKQRDADDRWNASEKNNDETDSGDENPRAIRLEHRRSLLSKRIAENRAPAPGDCEGNQNDPEVITKNRIV